MNSRQQLWRVLAPVALLVLGCMACATVEKAPADPRLVEALRAYEEGRKLEEAGQYAEAGPPAEHALELREAALGPAHPEVAQCLDLLGWVSLRQGDLKRAEQLFPRALEIREATFGGNHPDVAQSLNGLATVHAMQGQYARAKPLYERALAIREALLGKEHPDVAKSLNNLANLYYFQGDYAQAQPLYERALAIREAALGRNHPDVADSLNNLANLYDSQGRYALVEPLLLRALEIKEAAFGKEHLHLTHPLNNLALLYVSLGNHGRAEPLYERALAIQEKSLGKNHPAVAQTLGNLAELYRKQGALERAEPLYERAIAIEEATLGETHPELAISLNNLALLYKDQGYFAKAELLYERSLEIREERLGKAHPDVAQSLNNLANLYKNQGDYKRALPLYERALAIRKEALGEDHPDVADSLQGLANLHHLQEDYARARPLLERAVEIYTAAYGENHPQVAAALHNLANVYKSQGEQDRAEALYARALTTREASLGANHPGIVKAIQSLANLYQDRGDSARAEPLYARALAIYEASLGGSHPDFVPLLNSYAQLRLAQRRPAEALSFFERALHISEQHLRHEVFGFSEARLTRALQLIQADEERLYSLVRAYPDDARVRQLALAAALLHKGRSTEELAETSRIIYRGLGPAEREAFDRLRALRTRLAELSLAGPEALALDDYKRRVEELTSEGDTLEADLARRSEPLRALFELPPPAELVERVAAALPSDGALIEFVAYEDSPLVPRPGVPEPQGSGALRYLALLLFADGRTRAVELGPAAPIDRAVGRLHEALAGRYVSYQPPARALHALVFRPLRPLLGGVRRLFVSPDSQLALVPFDALHDGRRFLVDGFDITYLTSGKDLLPRLEGITPEQSVIVLADPDFGASPAVGSAMQESAPAPASRSRSLARFFSARCLGGEDKLSQPLPGTRQEAEAIHRLLPQAQVLMGSAASKEVLLKLATPGVLHIATHGFFLTDADASDSESSRAVDCFSLGGTGPSYRPSDPLLRSGLVLAGAHPRAAGAGASRREDSWVTALELAGLNLWGTQLVVLSACETGRGDVKLGQGVYGLRRALMVAGAQTLVTSLWKVDDEKTHPLMESYYRNLLAGQGRAEALRSAMKELRHKQPHPYFWAPFIAIGQDTPVQGLVPRTGP
ncbi:MAG TPA: tetratricopeptide repeat protein [Archangium sp.]|uniref:CHAT domain-containing tetratricopeptide repeat protein n=1 Tax=Archangium sp. TaxID=1872627 RepID=UPI002E36031D|nr:tetratricopeptide repeat protein [Archangium sp.]HEX5748797.1 tetratricopeptide repeat protein [Archangium sp.]